MSTSPPPPPHPSGARQPPAAPEGKSAKPEPAGAVPSSSPEGAPRPAGQPAPKSEQPQEERTQSYRREPREMFPVPQLPPPSFNVNVCRRGADPFLRGVVIGAVATVIGFLIGLLYFLLSR